MPFDRKTTTICNLISNSAVSEAVNGLGIQVAKSGLLGAADLKELISANRGKTLILFSHVADDNIVWSRLEYDPSKRIRDFFGKMVPDPRYIHFVDFSVSVTEIDGCARLNNCTLIHVGCNSAGGGSAIGMKTRNVNPLAVLQGLTTELNNCSNTWQVVRALSSPSNRMVVTAGVLASIPTFAVYARPNDQQVFGNDAAGSSDDSGTDLVEVAHMYIVTPTNG